MQRPKLLQNTFDFIKFTSFNFMPELTLRLEYRRKMGTKLNLDKPKSFTEKLQWLKLYWYDPKATVCADKYSVRNYVKSKGLSHILNDLYGVYEDVDDIRFDDLPNQFVMKVTHGCGQNLIVTDKSKVDWSTEKEKFRNWLKVNHFYNSLEWVYRDIKPRIIVERLITTRDDTSLKDYKFFCFNGEPKALFVASDRGDKTTKFDFFDLEWNKLEVKNHYPNSEGPIKKPEKLAEMIEYARVLSNGFPHVRIDFYIEEGEIIFGECTFFHFSGTEQFEPADFDFILGEYLTLPEKINRYSKE